jgi:hypothetical protein
MSGLTNELATLIIIIIISRFILFDPFPCKIC